MPWSKVGRGKNRKKTENPAINYKKSTYFYTSYTLSKQNTSHIYNFAPQILKIIKGAK